MMVAGILNRNNPMVLEWVLAAGCKRDFHRGDAQTWAIASPFLDILYWQSQGEQCSCLTCRMLIRSQIILSFLTAWFSFRWTKLFYCYFLSCTLCYVTNGRQEMAFLATQFCSGCG